MERQNADTVTDALYRLIFLLQRDICGITYDSFARLYMYGCNASALPRKPL